MAWIQVSRPVPTWKTQALVGRDFRTLSLDDYRGRWVVLLFYPLNFTFVCPTEIVSLNERWPDFQERNTEVLMCSVDSVYAHLGWVKSDERLRQLRFPLLSDITKEIARSYGVLLEDAGIALRATFVIDPRGILRWQCINDLNTGRNIDEIMRVIDALQTDKPCPCNWKKGDATLPG